jgi:H+/Cl- antiporter ClcA/CBS domain-containing protein
MAYLNGNAVPRLLEGRTLAVKWLGTLLSVASGVTLGLEAPLVHIGACVASLSADAAGRAWEVSYRAAERVAEWRSGESGGEQEHEQLLLSSSKSPKRRRSRFVPILQSDAERREFCSAGVAAGLAAAFGAPIGGVLFAMEEASTHWSRKVGWRCFLAATASAVTLNQLNFRAFGTLHFSGLAPLSTLEWAHQLPLLALVAALGGLVGAGFQALHRSAARRARRKRATAAAFVARAAATSAAIVLAMFALSLAAGTCVEVPEWRDMGKAGWLSRRLFSQPARAAVGRSRRREKEKEEEGSAFGLPTFFIPTFTHPSSFKKTKNAIKGYGFVLTCPAGTYNDLATLFFAPAADTASHIFSSGALTPRFNVCSHDGKSGTEEDASCYFTLRSLALLCPAYFLFMAASSASGLPGGLFLPSIVAGGSFGGTAGLLLSRALPALGLQAGLFAMVGATAALGGVFRASVALVVLVVEGTQSVRFLLAVAVAAIAANWAGDLCRPGGVYESDLEADGRVVFLRPTPPPALHCRSAGSVAARGVWAFREVESVAYVLDVLSRTRHNGFPVVRASSREREEEKKRKKEREQEEEKETRGRAAPVVAAEEEEEEEEVGVNRGGGGLSPDGPSAAATAAAPEEAASPAASPPFSSAASREGVLVGLILRSQLLVLLRARFFCDETGRAIPRDAADAAVVSAAEAATTGSDDHHQQQHDVFALDSAMRSFFRLSGAPTRRAASMAPALSAAVLRRRSPTTRATRDPSSLPSLSPSSSTSAALLLPTAPFYPPSLAECFVDLRPFMDRAPLSVRPLCPAERAHAAFVSLGLRHLPLTTAEGLVCGILTRKDLDAAAGAGPWRRSKIAPAPAPPPPGGLHVPSEFVGGPSSGGGVDGGGGGGAGPVAGIRRRARDFAAAAAAAAGSAVWHGGGGSNNGSSSSLQSQQGGGGGRGRGGGGDERV